MPAHSDFRFPEIARERVSDRVAVELLALIAGGRLRPGERLPGERRLAQMMNVSRVSVRAALQRLKAQGLLSAVQGGGTRVLSSDVVTDPPLAQLVRVNRENLHDLAEIRAILETWAARRAAAKATPAQLREIEGVLEAMSDEGRAQRFKAEDDIRFHFAIAKAAGSTVYMHMLSTIRDILSEMLVFHRYRLAGTPEDDRRLLAQHRAVFEAIRAGDGDAAARAMEGHLRWVLARYAEEGYATDGSASKRPAETSAPVAGRGRDRAAKRGRRMLRKPVAAQELAD
jgi:DNA-binding FadR family transcriptional regulator